MNILIMLLGGPKISQNMQLYIRVITNMIPLLISLPSHSASEVHICMQNLCFKMAKKKLSKLFNVTCLNLFNVGNKYKKTKRAPFWQHEESKQ